MTWPEFVLLYRRQQRRRVALRARTPDRQEKVETMDPALRYFIEVARLGTIRAASERLNVAASAISRHIKIFEEEFGAPLLQRSVRGIELTAAGEVFLEYAKAVVAERTRLRQSIDDLNGLRRGHVRLASIDGILAGPVSDIIAQFRTRYDGVTFELRSMGTEAVVEDVRRGDAEIGIAFNMTQSELTEGVRVAYRMPDPLCAIMSNGHPLSRLRRLRLEDILQFPIALPDRSFGVRRLMESLLYTGRYRPTVALETNSIEALRGFARSGAGITMLPFMTARRDVPSVKVRRILIEDAAFNDPSIHIFVHAERSLPVASSAFLNALCEAMANHTMDVGSSGSAL